MASSPNCSSNPKPYGPDTTTSSVQANTTFVQTDPSHFRTIVQKLTGAPTSTDKPPASGHPTSKRLAFKLHERRQTTNNYNNLNLNDHNLVNGSFLFSPVSTLDFLSPPAGGEYKCVGGREAEERAIAEKGFFLHPVIVSPLLGISDIPGGRRGGGAHDPPELLPLFPIRHREMMLMVECNASK